MNDDAKKKAEAEKVAAEADKRLIRHQVGDKVPVWPLPGTRVRERVDAPRVLPESGKEVVWSAWLESKLSTGEILLSDPAPKPAPNPAKPGPAPVRE